MKLTTHSATTLLALGTILGAGISLACNRDQVTQYNVSKEKGAQAAPAPAAGQGGMATPVPGAPGGMGSGMGAGEVPPPPRPDKGLKWTLPKGWTETGGSGMRFATLKPAGSGQAEVSVVVLPGAAGGELANVNRWRGQIGLSPMDEAALGAARKTVKSRAGSVSVFDFTSDGQVKSRMVTGQLTTADGNTWFLKLMGEADPVGKAKPEFMKLLETLHLD